MKSLNNIPIPNFLPPIPVGYVYLGAGGSFIPDNDVSYMWTGTGQWVYAQGMIIGDGPKNHYLAHETSKTVKLNTSMKQILPPEILAEIEKANELVGAHVRRKSSDEIMMVKAWKLLSPRPSNPLFQINLQGKDSWPLHEVELVVDLKVDNWTAREVNNTYFFTKSGETLRILQKGELRIIKEFLATGNASSVKIDGIELGYSDLIRFNL